MITLERDSLVFRFPAVHKHATTKIDFQRTLRIPDDGKHYPLPPGLGSFALKHVEDYAARVPESWAERSGVMMPLYQAEAMWLSFRRRFSWGGYPFALKIATGKINAISGKPWQEPLEASERDYVVVPEQPWLDGYCIAKDVVRQFVAMPLGAGYTVEEQITGKPEHGGLQIIAYPMKGDRYERLRRERERYDAEERARCGSLQTGGTAYALRRRMVDRASLAAPAQAMGLAAGGRMHQQIYADPYGLDAWDMTASSRCFVTLVDAVQWQEITGEAPAARPPTARDYTKAGLPWFDYYAEGADTLAGAPALTLVKSVAEMAAEKGDQVLGADGDVEPGNIIKLAAGGSTGHTPGRT
jgi:hypothetical protein